MKLDDASVQYRGVNKYMCGVTVSMCFINRTLCVMPYTRSCSAIFVLVTSIVRIIPVILPTIFCKSPVKEYLRSTIAVQILFIFSV